MTGIYKITNPEGKIYIGKSKDIVKRWKLYRLNKAVGQPKLNESFLKFGIDNHLFEIVEICDSSCLTEREAYYIDFHMCYDIGLNKSTSFRILLT